MHYLKRILGVIIVILIAGVVSLYYFGMFGSHLILFKTSFSHLPNWQTSDETQAFNAFRQSCHEILNRDPQSPFSKLTQSGNNHQWQDICLAADDITNPNQTNTKQFFEQWFIPYYVFNNFNSQGLFTGYYLPELQVSHTKDQNYTTPIYAVPHDLIKVNLGLFNPLFNGKYIVGQLKNNTLAPYPDRTAINNGSIPENTNVIAWANNPIDVFFAQIQGSAIIDFPDHQQLLIGYDADNGHQYTAIGKVLLENHYLSKQDVSLQSIRTWLLQHPNQINDILNQDKSYVFFRVIGSGGPTGKEGIPLTPRGSLAIDNNYIPLGVPIWLNTNIPQMNNDQFSPFNQLLIAQDVGGAIKGIVRGDVYWGSGDEAAYIAGHMKSKGKYWMLLPKFKECCKAK